MGTYGSLHGRTSLKGPWQTSDNASLEWCVVDLRNFSVAGGVVAVICNVVVLTAPFIGARLSQHDTPRPFRINAADRRQCPPRGAGAAQALDRDMWRQTAGQLTGRDIISKSHRDKWAGLQLPKGVRGGMPPRHARPSGHATPKNILSASSRTHRISSNCRSTSNCWTRSGKNSDALQCVRQGS